MTQGIGPSVDRVSLLVALLAKQRGLTSVEIAETLWLALQIEPEKTIKSEKQSEKKGKNDPQHSSTKNNNEGDYPTGDLGAVSPSLSSRKVDLSMPTPKMEALPTEALPVWLADPSMLSNSLLVIRALKPLLQKVAAGVGRKLDETATVERVARTQMMVPILQAHQEQWFDILLVVDRGSSMHIWDRLVNDVVRILRCYGAFRDVRVFDLDVRSDAPGGDDSVGGHQTVQSSKEMTSIVLRSVPKGTEHRPSELLDQQGRRVVIVLSDCAGKYWWNGTLLPMLHDWGRVMPMVVWQMLPMRMWKRTALGRGTAVAIVNDRPGVANQQLLSQRFDIDEDFDGAKHKGMRLPMPVVTSQVSDLDQWSRMVAGDRRQSVPGFLLPPQGGRVPRSQSIEDLAQKRADDDKASKTTVEEYIGVIAQERVQRFQQLSSPAAQRLVMLLAAAPVITLPVVRLIRDSMLYADRSPLPVAEVFLGGLLQRLEEQVEIDFELVQYDFLPKVRETLLSVLPAVDTVDVINRVSAAVERRWNRLRPDQSFKAFLMNPNVQAPPELEGLRSFASVTADILDQLVGEDYKTFAQQLRQGLPEPKGVIESKFPGLPSLEAFSFKPPILSFQEEGGAIPPTELETVEVATVVMEPEVRSAVIVTSLTVESLAVRRYLSDIQEELHPQGTIYERGYFDGNGRRWKVRVLEGVIGNVRAAVEVERAIAYFQPDVLLFVGIAGGIRNVALGDVVAATKVFGYEASKTGGLSLRPMIGQSDYALLQQAKAEARKGDWLERISGVSGSDPRVLVAPIAAGEKVIASFQSQVFQFLRTNYGDAIAVEMEGDGVLREMLTYDNTQSIVIRGISDLLDSANDLVGQESEQERQERAAFHASAFAFEVLSKFDPDLSKNATADSLREFVFESVTLLRASELAVKPPTEGTIYFRADRFSQSSRSPVTPYENYALLSRSEREGDDYQIRIRTQSSDTAIVALHGGKMEPGTSELADAVAGNELAFYSFEGLKSQGNGILSIRGAAFDEPRGIELIESVDRVLEFHGDVSQNAVVLIGGRDTDWIERLESTLTTVGFEVQRSHRGEKEGQPCNRGKTGAGVYIDLPQRLRQELFDSLENESTSEESRFSQFVKAIRASIPSLHSAWVEQRQSHRRERLIEALAEDVELELVAIPSGEFMMGSPDSEPERDDDESPQHPVAVSSFYMGRYPITQAQYEAVMGSNPATQYDSDRFVAPDKPVVGVSWEDAQAFCQRLSEQTGKEYRLPSEAEWEYACRAGTTTPFHFGEMITTEVANYNGSSFNDGPEGSDRNQLTSVTEFDHANAFGLSDMHGNVREWCLDRWHSNYENAPTDGSAWVEGSDNDRLIRGGSWDNFPGNCRSAYRYFITPGLQHNYLGFRVVLAPRSAPPSR